eukprot:191662_1
MATNQVMSSETTDALEMQAGEIEDDDPETYVDRDHHISQLKKEVALQTELTRQLERQVQLQSQLDAQNAASQPKSENQKRKRKKPKNRQKNVQALKRDLNWLNNKHQAKTKQNRLIKIRILIKKQSETCTKPNQHNRMIRVILKILQFTKRQRITEYGKAFSHVFA